MACAGTVDISGGKGSEGLQCVLGQSAGLPPTPLHLGPASPPWPPALPCPPAGEDKRVHMWDVGSWKPFAKAQPLQKAVCHSIGWAPWGGTGLGLHPSLLLATGEW